MKWETEDARLAAGRHNREKKTNYQTDDDCDDDDDDTNDCNDQHDDQHDDQHRRRPVKDKPAHHNS